MSFRAPSSCLALAVVCSAGSACAFDLPSGVTAKLHEVLLDTVGEDAFVRFRFVAPSIDASQNGAPGYSELEADFPHLCTTLALPYLREYDLSADQIVISISDRVTEFGVMNADATQYFEQFRPENDDCIWEGF